MQAFTSPLKSKHFPCRDRKTGKGPSLRKKTESPLILCDLWEIHPEMPEHWPPYIIQLLQMLEGASNPHLPVNGSY